jgi:hypothetical protein
VKTLESNEKAFLEANAALLLGLAWRGFQAHGRGAVLIPSSAMRWRETSGVELGWASLDEVRGVRDIEDADRALVEYDPAVDAVVVFLRDGTTEPERMVSFAVPGLTPKIAAERLNASLN